MVERLLSLCATLGLMALVVMLVCIMVLLITLTVAIVMQYVRAKEDKDE